MADPPLERARRSVAAGEWADALRALEEIADDRANPEVAAELLELRAMAEYGNGRFEAAVEAWEQLHTHCMSAGDVRGAARAAAMVAMFLMMDTGLMAPVRGWLRRAERLVADDDVAPAHALVAMTRTYERFMSGDMEAVRAQSARAIELGTRLDVPPAVVIGRVAAARVVILDGDVEAGMAQLDEIATLLMSGSVDPLTTGMMYCELICAAQGLSMHGQAREWTGLMEGWRHGNAFGGINGRCRVHRAEMLRMSGPCDAAEDEALRACEELRPWMRREFGWPLAELGTIRLRRGDLDGAEAVFREAHEHAWSPHPGLALVHLERGDIPTAMELIADAIERPFDLPSKERPPFGDLRLAPLLDAQAEIAAAAGEVDLVRSAARRLRAIADTYRSSALEAAADLAEGRAALVAGDPDVAGQSCARAVEGWVEVGAPYEAATARLVLGSACRELGHAEAARLEWGAARDAFVSFGARRRAEHAQQLLETLPDKAAAATPAATRAADRTTSAGVFRAEGDTRVVALGGIEVRVRDLKGFRYVEQLLAAPGREFRALDLVGNLTSADAVTSHADDDLELVEGTGGPLPTIDDQARRAYRRRLAEVDEDIDDAVRWNDLGRLELARRDREFLLAELARATGLGGRARSVGGSAERARTSVTRSIRYAIDRLRDHHPSVAAHFDRCIATGTYCSYRPDPIAGVTWNAP